MQAFAAMRVLKAAMHPAVAHQVQRTVARRRSPMQQAAAPQVVAWPQKSSVIARAAGSVAQANELEVNGFAEQGVLRINVRVPPSRVQEICNGVVQELRANYRVPGFRDQTTVPADMVIKAAGGESRIRLAYVEACLQSTMQEAFSEYEGQLVDGSQKVESSIEELVKSFSATGPFEYSASAEEGDIGLEFLADYKGMEITVKALSSEESEAMEVETMIAGFLKGNGGTLSVVTERGLVLGDTLIAEHTCRTADTDEILMDSDGATEIDTSDASTFYPGLMHELVGIMPGENRVLSFAFTEENSPSEEMVGVDAKVFVRAKELFEWKLPMLTLELVNKTMPEIKSLDQLRESLHMGVKLAAHGAMTTQVQEAIGAQLAGIVATKTLPPSTFRTFAMEQYSQELQNAIKEGELSEEELPQYSTEEAVNAYLEDRREYLEQRFKVMMALDAIFEREQLKIDEEMVNSRIAQLISEADGEKEKLDVEAATHFYREHAKTFAALAFLQEHAVVKVVPLSEQVE